MKYVAIYNQETMEIVAPEVYEGEAEAKERKRQFDIEVMGRGPGWISYIGDQPFEFTEPEDMSLHMAEMKRAERNQKLSECDWTQLSDSPAKNSPEWLVYRQALRDITSKSGFPDSITWPKEPEHA